MPYQKTKVREKLREKLNQLYNLRDSGNQPVELFTDLAESLETLWECSSALYVRDGQGKFPPLTAERFAALMDAYADANRKAEQLLGAEEASQAEALLRLTADINALLLQDKSALENIVPGKDITLPEVIEKGRSVTVDLGKVQLTGSGNALSNRIPVSYKLPDGTLRNGFFTQKGTVPGRKEFAEAYKPLEAKYPQFALLFRALDAADDKTLMQEMPWAQPLAMPFLLDNPNPQLANEACFDLFFGELKMPLAVKRQLSAEPKFWQFYSDLYDVLGPLKIANMTYTDSESWLGGKSGERIDNRNSALSMVAKLMGRPELIAPAEPMTVIVDGKKLEGTFMENAYGKEVFGLDRNDPVCQYTAENYNNPAVFADIADLQVIDFISGNVDRHEGNFFMQFDGNGPDAKLTKLTGIDNDLSFGLNTDQDHMGNLFVIPRKMGMIEKETAAKIQGLTEASLKFALSGFGLNEQQLSAAWQRTRLLQEQISASLTHYQNVPEGTVDEGFPRIVAKENMAQYSLEKLSRSVTNQFTVFSGMKRKIASRFGAADHAEKVRKKYKDRLGLADPPEKPKAKRLVGDRVMDGLFLRPEEIPPVQAKAETVDVEIAAEAKQDTLKGTISSRKALRYTDGKQVTQKGFFTARTELDEKANMTAVFRDLRLKYPVYGDFLGSMERFVKQGGDYNHIDRGFPGYSRGDMNVLTADQQFSAMLKDATQSVKNAKSVLSQYIGVLGLSKTATIDMRNVGMSRIAELMGCGERIAHAEPMRLKQGNLVTEGIFMKLAEGTDVGGVRPGDPILGYSEDVYNHGPGLKALSDLQILDYICMNVDRHAQNLTYQFTEINGQPRFTGVCGFDNDASFLEKRVDANSAFSNDGALNDIKTISKEQANFLLHCDPTQIEEALSGLRFTPKEISATEDRIERLRERIRDQRITVLDDEAWKTKTMAELCSGQNIFSRVKNQLSPEVLERKAQLNEAEGPKKPLTFTEGTVKKLTEADLTQAQEKLQKELDDALVKRGLDPEKAANRIMKERTAMEAQVIRESEANRLAKNPLGEEGLRQLRDSTRMLGDLLERADHFFGGSDEFKKLKTGYQDFSRFLAEQVPAHTGGSAAAQMQLQEDFKEHLQYLEVTSDAMLRKIGNSQSQNQLDRKAFAEAVKQLSTAQQERFRAYNRALLERQQELDAAQNQRAAKPLEDYLQQQFGNRRPNPRNDEEFPDYCIKNGLSVVSSAIGAGTAVPVDAAEQLAAALLIRCAMEDVRKSEGEPGLAAFHGNLKTMIQAMQQQPKLKEYAQHIVEDPRDFADTITTGRFEKVYTTMLGALGMPGKAKDAPVRNVPQQQKQQDAPNLEKV